jgi:hypothetical protein
LILDSKIEFFLEVTGALALPTQVLIDIATPKYLPLNYITRLEKSVTAATGDNWLGSSRTISKHAVP